MIPWVLIVMRVTEFAPAASPLVTSWLSICILKRVAVLERLLGLKSMEHCLEYSFLVTCSVTGYRWYFISFTVLYHNFGSIWRSLRWFWNHFSHQLVHRCLRNLGRSQDGFGMFLMMVPLRIPCWIAGWSFLSLEASTLKSDLTLSSKTNAWVVGLIPIDFGKQKGSFLMLRFISLYYE